VAIALGVMAVVSVMCGALAFVIGHLLGE